MIITFNKEVLDDAKLLVGLEPEVFAEFSRIAVDNIKQGSNTDTEKKYRKAAKTLGVDVSAITAAIYAVSFFLLEATKRHINEQDFTNSMQQLQLPTQHTQTLIQQYLQNQALLQSYLSSFSLQLPHFQHLDWRLDVEVSRRSLQHCAVPSYLLELSVQQAGQVRKHLIQSDYAALVQLEHQLEAAVKEVNKKEVRRIMRYVK